MEVQPSYGLTDEQVERMLIESFEHAEQDIRSRQVLDARTEAETILMAAARAMNDYGEDAVSPEERAKIQEAVSALEEACRGEDAGSNSRYGRRAQRSDDAARRADDG